MAESEKKNQALLVEDNAIMRVLLSSMLMRRGYDVVEVDCGDKALPLLADGNFDLIVLDVMLPGLSGIELCHVLREDLGQVDLPVIGVTGLTTAENIAHMKLAGFNDVLLKPLDSEALDAALTAVLH